MHRLGWVRFRLQETTTNKNFIKKYTIIVITRWHRFGFLSLDQLVTAVRRAFPARILLLMRDFWPVSKFH